MKTKIICLIDRSSSMSSILNKSIESFNSFLEEQKNVKGKAKIDIILFDDKIETIVSNKKLKNVEPITTKEYFARGSTSLYDAISLTINNELDYLSENPKNRSDKTLVVILTDGEENSSTKYNSEQTKSWIKEMEEYFNWKFIYLGANQDSMFVANSLGISSAMNWYATNEGITVAYSNINNATKYYRTTNENDYSDIFEKSKDIN